MNKEENHYTFKSLVGDLQCEIFRVGNFDYEGSESYFVTDSPDALGLDKVEKQDLLFQGSDTQKYVSASFLKLKQLQDQTQDLLNHPKAIPNELDLISEKLNEAHSLTEARLKSLDAAC